MAFWFLLFLGLLTYLMMQYSVARATRTPVWLLWLVLMTPAFILTGLTLIYGVKQAPPSALIPLVAVVSVGCLLLYWLLYIFFLLFIRNKKQTFFIFFKIYLFCLNILMDVKLRKTFLSEFFSFIFALAL